MRVGSEPLVNSTLPFFQLSQVFPFPKTLLYTDEPSFYIWNATRRIFCRKQGTPVEGYEEIRKNNALGVHTLYSKNAKYFYLRMLLQEIRSGK